MILPATDVLGKGDGFIAWVEIEKIHSANY